MKIEEFKQLIRDEFKKIDEDKDLISNLERTSLMRSRPVAKNVIRSERAREEGNKLFGNFKPQSLGNYRILHLYNESVAFARPKSEELAKAYGNRSALLRRMLKFKHCISEADKALEVTKSVTLKIKLLCRKAECFTALHSSENKKCVEEARNLLAQSEELNKTKEMLSNFIDRAQYYIDNPEMTGFNDEQIFDKIQAQSANIVAAAKKVTSIGSSLKMKYNKKYGHYLVAARDFKPGEIMCVKEPYHTQIMDCKTPSHCCRCANFLWTIIPCDFCSWYVYCSEHCKTENWNDHHDIECSALQNMKNVLAVREYVDLAPDALFFKALKEAGSIDRLQTEVELLEKYEDHSENISMTEEKFRSYKTLFLAPTRSVPEEEFHLCIRSAAFSVMGYAKPLLKAPYSPFNLKMLMKDERAIFMGAFLAKLNIINKGMIQTSTQFDPAPTGCSNVPKMNATVLMALLSPVSCVANVGYCQTSHNKCIMYAVQPIKAGDQLFTTLHLSSIYDNTPKSQRETSHKSFDQSPCGCQACVYDWDKVLINPAQVLSVPESKAAVYEELVAELDSIRREMAINPLYKMQLVDPQHIVRIRKLIVKAWEHFPMPSRFTLEVTQLMIKLFEVFFPPHTRILIRMS